MPSTHIIDDVLLHLEHCIANNKYEPPARYNLALLSDRTDEMIVTINAFLNTDGGTIIWGINDNRAEGRYVFSGATDVAACMLLLQHTSFTNSRGMTRDTSYLIASEPKHFLNGEVVVITVTALPAKDRYAFTGNTAYIRAAGSNKQIQRAGEKDTAEPAAPTFQKIYSAELITLFGQDYISLGPDLKQLLSFIYEHNHADEPQYPTAAEICKRIWDINGIAHTPVLFEHYAPQIKKLLSLLEKSNFIQKHLPGAGYKINTHFVAVKGLFN